MSEEQKIQELLRKRAKVENKWPGCQFEVGDILINDGDFYWVIGDVSWHGKIPKQEVEPFPYLMTPLPWWSDRKLEELPAYVNMYMPLPERFRIVKVDEWQFRNTKSTIIKSEGHWRELGIGDKPATEAEYLEFKNKQGGE